MYADASSLDLELAEKLWDPPLERFCIWSAVLVFYAAIHLVDSLLSAVGKPKPKTHNDRFAAFKSVSAVSMSLDAKLRTLKNACDLARYHLRGCERSYYLGLRGKHQSIAAYIQGHQSYRQTLLRAPTSS